MSIISDKDPRFIFRFWQSLQQAFTIQTLKDLLRAWVLQFGSSWEDHLMLLEFSYNNSYHISIRIAPFEALYGRKCQSPLYWVEIGEKKLIGPEIIQSAVDKIAIVRKKLKVAQDHQKS